MEDGLLTVKDLEKYLQLSRSTIYRMVHRDGGLPAMKVGRAFRFRRSDIHTFIQKSSPQSAAS